MLGKKIYKPPYTITSKMLTLSTEIGVELTQLESNTINITPKLRKKNRVKTLAGTLEIEGNFLGEEKITAILEGKRVLGTMQEVTEVEGAINAYKKFDNYKYDKLEDLLGAHKILMNGLLNNAGNFRNVNVGVGSSEGVTHVAPPFGNVPELMNNLFEWLKNSDEHPLIKSCVFHYEFEFIHPFTDGNGRIGRLWQSIILYNWKNVFNAIPTEGIIRDYQDRYYEVLEESGSLGESTPFIEFMLEVILETIKSSVKDSVKSSVNTEDNIFELLKQNPQSTIKELAHILDLTTRAIEKQISKLKIENRIVRIGSARKGYWNIIDE